MPTPTAGISAEQFVQEAFTALQEHKATTVSRADATTAYEGIKQAVIQVTQAHLGAARAAH